MKKGFTLIELLVVIAIIATFLTAGLGSFATAQKKGRDTKRKSDMREIQSALEQYYSVCGFIYPTPAGNFYTSIQCGAINAAIMPVVPEDPRKVTPYYCGPTPGAGNCTIDRYTICAMLESEANNTFCVNSSQ